MSDEDDLYFCSLPSILLYYIYTVYVLLGLSVLPFAIWCLLKHRKYHQTNSSSNKLVYRLSTIIYICTITGSISAILQFTDCMNISVWMKHTIAYFKSFAWTFQGIVFLLLLFLRVNVVFEGSAYKVSKCTKSTFIMLYTVLIFCIIGAIFGQIMYYFMSIDGVWITYTLFYALSLLLTIILGIYLATLFIYKLIQLNNMTKDIDMTKEKSVSSISHYESNGDKLSTTNEPNGDKLILSVVRKCAILTSIALITLFCVFICVLIAALYGTNDTLLVIWGAAIIIDTNTTFFCVMLSNSFCQTQYMFICGWLDNCLHLKCFRKHEISNMENQNKSPSIIENELSSYVETNGKI